MEKPSIILVTNSYPFGGGEKFLEDEIGLLAERFECVYIIPALRPRGQARSLPQNCIIWPRSYNLSRLEPLIWLHWAIKAFQDKFCISYQRTKQLLKFFVFALIGSASIRELVSTLQDNKNPFLIYHYWKNETLLWSFQALQSEHSEAVIVSRAHRYDLYREGSELLLREKLARIPCRIYPISQHGESYLKNELSHRPEQIALHRLGVRIPTQSSPIPSSTKIEIVTLAFLNKVKRLDIIAKALKLSEESFKWHLIGDGPEKANLEGLISELPNNVEVIQYGLLDSEEISDFFKVTPLHFLVSVSESEGVPVSMMESISWGVPVIGTAVGGVPEIVNKETGFLVPANLEPKELLGSILSGAKKYDGCKWRASCKAEAAESWDASKNHSAFLDDLMQNL